MMTTGKQNVDKQHNYATGDAVLMNALVTSFKDMLTNIPIEAKRNTTRPLNKPSVKLPN